MVNGELAMFLAVVASCGGREPTRDNAIQPRVVETAGVIPGASTPDAEPIAVPATVDAAVAMDAAPARSPPIWQFTIVKVDVDGPGCMLTLGGGARAGIFKGWRAYIVDTEGRPVQRGELELLVVHDSFSVARSKLSPDQAKQYKHVRAEPR